MRIISSWKDYYDCMQDPSDKVNVWVREHKDWDLRRNVGTDVCYNGKHTITTGLIGFCGKLYLFTTFDGDFYFNYRLLKDRYLKEGINLKDLYRRSGFGGALERMRIYQTAEYYDGELEQVFVEHRVPVFAVVSGLNYAGVSRNSHIILNPCLKQYKWYKIFNTQSVYQEIEMYLFGILGCKERNIPEVSNDDLIIAKGFDLKTSFRKEKSK